MAEREFDVVVWGATGFTGRLVAEYLAERYAVGGDLRWALAGRNREKLEDVRVAVAGGRTDALPIVTAESLDATSMADLAARTRVVCSTVGPYARYGTNLVAACAEHGTHYCDLTGEIHWMRRMIDAYQTTAERTGARIVFSCGFDCIPSDLGVYFIQRTMRERHGVPAQYVKYRVEAFKGAASGGTVGTMMNMMEEAGRDPEIMMLAADPYALNPLNMPRGLDGPDQTSAVNDHDFGQWTAPFVMAGVNTRVVRRTNALLNYVYGHDFRYDEAMLTGKGGLGFAKASAISAGTAAMNTMMTFALVRASLAPVLPSPGEGPSPAQQEAGFFDVELLAKHPADPAKNLRAHVHGDRDPGYGSTARMLGESAACLATDDLPVGGGLWTTASAMGDALLDRLPANAGVTFTLRD